MKAIPFLSALGATLFAACGLALGQANINEGLETAKIYVDVVNGSDSNPGTQAKPFKTLTKATAVADANNMKSVGTHVYLAPGYYREGVSLTSHSNTTTLPITFEATAAGTIVSGADLWNAWKPVTGKPGVYSKPWPYAWGLCPLDSGGPLEQNITLRREMVFVSGVSLTQVLTLNQLGLGSFFVDETGGTIYIYPPAGTNIGSAAIEIPTRASIFSAVNRSNIVLRGLTFQYGNPCRNSDQVSFGGSNNILIDSSSFKWSNAGGIGFSGTNHFTVQNSLAKHNGERGFHAIESKYGLWTSNEADYTNWRGAQGGIYGWQGGGFHFFAEHNNTVNGAKMLFNMTHGTHWDTDDENDTSTNVLAVGNLRVGVFFEKSQGPISLSNSYVCGNSLLGLYFDGGVSLRASTYVTLDSNVIAYNFDAQIPSIGVQGGVPIQVTNYETNEVYNLLTNNLTMTSNQIGGTAGEQLFDDFDQAGSAWTGFVSTLGSDHNVWWNPAKQPFTEPEPAYFTTVTWPVWKSTTGQDSHSTYGKPTVDPTGPCQVTADAPDFWLVDFDQGALTVTHGSPAVYTLLEIPLDGYNVATTFTSNGVSAIPGTTSSWSATSLPGSGSVQFTVQTSASTPPGNYPITLAAHSGNLMRTVTVELNVQ
jgi:Protein of unknown function (DUF1565)